MKRYHQYLVCYRLGKRYSYHVSTEPSAYGESIKLPSNEKELRRFIRKFMKKFNNIC